MVKTDGKNLIIEMPNTNLVDYLHALQHDIINAIQCYNYRDFGESNGCPFFTLLELLTATLPTPQDIEHVTEFKKMARNRTPEAPRVTSVDHETDSAIRNRKSIIPEL